MHGILRGMFFRYIHCKATWFVNPFIADILLLIHYIVVKMRLGGSRSALIPRIFMKDVVSKSCLYILQHGITSQPKIARCGQ